MRRDPVAALLIAALTFAASAEAQRRETILPARVAVLDNCPLTPVDATLALNERGDPGKESGLEAIGASIVGDLVTAGVSAFAGALESASAEHGFVVEDVADFEFYSLRHPKDKEGMNDAAAMPRLVRRQACLVLYVPGVDGGLDEFSTAADLKQLDERSRSDQLGGLRTFSEIPATVQEAKSSLKSIGC